MVEINNMQFASSIGVLYTLKEARGHKTLQETYSVFENADIDTIVEILRVAYNRQNNSSLNEEQFFSMLEKNKVGFIQLAEIFQQVVEQIMYDGLTPEEVDSKKKFLESQRK